MLTLPRLFAIMELVHAFRRVKRTGVDHKIGEPENDAEHALQLAIVAWYIADSMQLALDLGKVILYALAHDLVEAYAGDVICHKKDPNKKAREHAAALRIEREFPEFPHLHTTIKAYEAREDPESKFLWALDKLLPIVNILISGIPQWKNHGVTLESLLELKTPQIMSAQELVPVFEELVEHLRHHPELFPPST